MANEQTNPNETNENNGTDTSALEAKIKALEAERDKLKQSVTNASADASAWKKKFQDTLSEQDKLKAEQDENTAAMKSRLEQLENERNIANYAAALGASDIGMDAETAKAVAEALNAKDANKVFDGIRRFITSHDKAMAEKAMMNNPKLPGGGSEKAVATKEEFKRMGYMEMLQFKTEHPELYAEYTK